MLQVSGYLLPTQRVWPANRLAFVTASIAARVTALRLWHCTYGTVWVTAGAAYGAALVTVLRLRQALLTASAA